MEPVPVLSLDDLLQDHSIRLQQEASDKATIESIGLMPLETLKTKLLTWVSLKMPAAYPVLDISLQPPSKCSDGLTRGLAEYIVFVTGRPFQDHVADLQQKVSGVSFGFQNLGSALRIVVSKAEAP